ncbi:hypothetical protein [Alkalihalobacillus sp. BA299]|uniref:hypothetical protein n=1 Tax=Alkalihalobacillus sp. BA299 TaxID=2815938 RepID=UPI001ADB4873|nr:hypothetical protein [Alkalihalobacillus sp. BA299]
MKNTLIICNCNNSIPYIISALEKKEDEVSIISGYQPYIVHPYDSILRTIILAAHQHDTKEVIFVSVKNPNVPQITTEWTGAKEAKHTIALINYALNDQSTDFSQWLGEHDEDEMLCKSVEYLRKHPLLPKNVLIKGLIWENQSIRETAS